VIALLLMCSMAWISDGLAQVLQLDLADTVNPATSGYVVRALAEAEQAAADLVLIRLDTPGGLDSATQEMVAAILNSPVPVVVWVGPPGARAASAGTFIVYAADVATMASGTSVGAAHPVALTGEETESATVEKAVNDAVARLRSIAELRGRNATWAEEAVRKSATATASEALELGVIDLKADSVEGLLIALDGWELPDGRVLRTATLELRTVPMGVRERLFSMLANPNLVYILLMLGLYGLIYEFFSPGIGIGFAVGGISLLLALLGLQVLPFSFVGVGLILFGVSLMVLDAFTPTDGILTLGGLVGLVLGSFSLFELDTPVLGLSWATIAVTVTVLTAIFLFIASKGLLAQRRPGRAMTTMEGLAGVAKDDLTPEGWVHVHGEYWHARGEGEKAIHAGDPVVVLRQEGRTLIVRRRAPAGNDAGA